MKFYDWCYNWIDKLFEISSKYREENPDDDEWCYMKYCLNCNKYLPNESPEYEYESHPHYHRMIELKDIEGIYEFLKYVSGENDYEEEKQEDSN